MSVNWFLVSSEPDINIVPITIQWESLYGAAEIVGEKFDGFLLVKDGKTMSYFHPKGALIKIGTAAVRKFKKDRKFIDALEEKIMSSSDNLLDFTGMLFKKDLKNSSTKQLFNYYSKLVKLVYELCSYGTICTAIEWEAPLLSSEVKDYLKKNFGDSSEFDEYFAFLTTPHKVVFSKQAEKSIIKILKKIKKNKKTLKLFRTLNEKELLKALPEKSKKINSMIDRHTENYCWISFCYEGPVFTKKDFISDLKHRVVEKKFIFLDELTELKKKKKAILKNLDIDEFHFYLLKVLNKVAILKLHRKEVLSKAYYESSFLFNELAKRKFVSVNQLRSVLPYELKDFLFGKPDLEEITARTGFCVVHSKNKKTKVFTGRKAEKLKEEAESCLGINKGASQLVGECAFPGQVIGTIKIVNSIDELNKVTKGDILVSFATNPSIIPAMKKAGAIVTDAGGITSHASIVSRELKIPCLIGTRFATRIFKDNDLVEVDATNGVVKLIKKGKEK